MPDARPRPAVAEAIWVISDIAPTGTYVTTVQAGPDHAVTLDPDRALRYAATVTAAAGRAEYDAAVYAQMRHMGLAEGLAAGCVADLRADRPPLDDQATGPLRFEPIIASRDKTAAVHVHLDGHAIAQWSPADARGHALHVLDVLAGVDLDAAYHRYLVGPLGLNDARARAVVGDIANHRAGGEGRG